MGNVCSYFLLFSSWADDIPSSSGIRKERTLVRYSLFLRRFYPLETDITAQLCDHRGHQCHVQGRVGLYGLFLL